MTNIQMKTFLSITFLALKLVNCQMKVNNETIKKTNEKSEALPNDTKPRVTGIG
jgi:hypothetical protein